jgi:asparagine synthase (glutamine-hydrolysing)
MCGIAGVISKQPIDATALKSMGDSMAHRGPDDERFFVCGEVTDTFESEKLEISKLGSAVNIGLAHRRLSIHDLSSLGHQPMGYMDRYKIVFNGEIYNYLELKDELLSLGYGFSSDTDTEVILAAYDAWGAACLNRFNGMWAFVIFDTKLQKILISRDRFGIKPLFFYTDNDRFIFASEVKAIFASGLVEKALNLSYCAKYLVDGGYEWLKECAFEGIYRFDFAHYYEGSLEALLDGSFELKRFWELSVDTSGEEYDEAKAKEYISRYQELFSDAVRLRLMADVSVSSSLSGGLDSSSIVCEINKQLRSSGKQEAQEVFSCVYRSENTEHCDESAFIDMTSEKLGIKSNKIEPDGQNILNEYMGLLSHFDTPPISSFLSTWHTYKLEKDSGITVTLDGQGADETMAGYGYYFFTHFFHLSYKNILRDIFLCKGKNFKYAVKGAVFKMVNTLFGLDTCKRLLAKLGKSDSFLMPLNEKMAMDLKEELVGNLHIGDHASMAYSVEVRMPFMDYRLVEFLLSIPAAYKIHDGWSKFLGRSAFDGLLPDEVVWRKDKMGWPIPEDFWFRKLHRQWTIEKIENSRILTLLNFDKQAFLNGFDSIRISKVMLVLNLAVWYEIHFVHTAIPNISKEK